MKDGSVELVVKATLTGVALVALARASRRSWPPGGSPRWLVALSLLSVLAYYNVGIHGKDWSKLGQKIFHGVGVGYVHHWETFHYVLGSKYFEELGYDGLYAASILAQSEIYPRGKIPKQTRDLRTNQIVDFRTLAPEMRRIRGNFSEERWETFKSDNGYFVDSTHFKYIERIRKDHGYNPPPAWTFVAQKLVPEGPIEHRDVLLLTLLDPLLLAAMFAAIFWAFGLRVGCIALIVFGLGYPWRFSWVGGAFLRHDWLAAVVIGTCLLEKRRFAMAGGLFAYAALVRIFPVLFLFGLAVVGVRMLIKKEPRAPVIRFALGYAVVLALGLWAGAETGRGFSAWVEFFENIAKHDGTWLTNNFGSRNIVLYDLEIYGRRLVDRSLDDAFANHRAHLAARSESLAPLVWLLSLGILALTALAAWRCTPSQAAVLGVVACFALVAPTCYYWAMLVLIPLAGSRRATLGLLLVNLFLIVLHLVSRGHETVYGLGAWALLAYFVDWLFPEARKTFLREPLKA